MYYNERNQTRKSMETRDTINLLIIDDDTSYVAVVQSLLSKFQGKKFEVVWKKDGASAIEELGKNPSIDLILVDYYLPEVNGLEVTRAIREKNTSIPIIFLTSSRDFRLAIEAMKYGVEDYMVKDDAVDSVLPRTIVNILERVALKLRIGEQQKADLIARKRTEAIKELVVTVCHEFNNPLAAIKISTDILSRQNLPAAERALVAELDSNIGVVEQEISRLRDINFEKLEF
jgi:DNA-binding response OmpR family regulator